MKLTINQKYPEATVSFAKSSEQLHSSINKGFIEIPFNWLMYKWNFFSLNSFSSCSNSSKKAFDFLYIRFLGLIDNLRREKSELVFLTIESFDVEFIKVVYIEVVLICGDVEIAAGSTPRRNSSDLALSQLFFAHQFQ